MPKYKFSKDDCKKGGGHNKTTIEDLINGNHGKHKSYGLKIELFKAGLLEDKCCICGWNEKRKGAEYSSCHLDHIDGDHNNNKLNNLRILCPNCHSLTETYCIRKNKR